MADFTKPRQPENIINNPEFNTTNTENKPANAVKEVKVEENTLKVEEPIASVKFEQEKISEEVNKDNLELNKAQEKIGEVKPTEETDLSKQGIKNNISQSLTSDKAQEADELAQKVIEIQGME
jgi:hypothetical protein